MTYNNILFDLDGTLTDPKEGITKAVAYALRHYGIEPPPLDELCPFIGPPLADSFVNFYGFTPEQGREAVSVYREYFDPIGKFENIVYDGIEEMLIKLRSAGKRLIVATSKPEKFAIQILEHFGLAEYFDVIRGSMLNGQRESKAEVIQAVLNELEGSTIMVGDRCYDVNGAHACSINCIGVLYGYGSQTELEEAGAEFIAADISQLTALLLG